MIKSQRVSDDSRAEIDGNGLDKNEVNSGEVDDSELNGVEVDDNEVEEDEVKKKVQKTFKSKKMVGLDFFNPRARLAFIKLRQIFVRALIFHHLDLERHILVETDVLGYAVDGILDQLILEDQWHPVAFLSC